MTPVFILQVFFFFFDEGTLNECVAKFLFEYVYGYKV